MFSYVQNPQRLNVSAADRVNLTLTSGALTPTTALRLLSDLGDLAQGAIDAHEEMLEIKIDGIYTGSTVWDIDPSTARALAAAGARLEDAVGRLQSRGSLLVCMTAGENGGPLLEMALMADVHLMEAGAALVLPGLFDEYIPCAGGWSRIIRRAGAGRARALLLSSRRIEADAALAAGLCDGIDDDGKGQSSLRLRHAAASSTAVRLAGELAHRAGRGSGLTQRQSRVIERAAFALAFASGEPAEGIAAFFEGRPARFTGAGRP